MTDKEILSSYRKQEHNEDQIEDQIAELKKELDQAGDRKQQLAEEWAKSHDCACGLLGFQEPICSSSGPATTND